MKNIAFYLLCFIIGFMGTSFIIDKGELLQKKIVFSVVVLIISGILYIIGSLKKK